VIFWDEKTTINGRVTGFEPSFLGGVVIFAVLITVVGTGIYLGIHYGGFAVLGFLWAILGTFIWRMRREYKLLSVKKRLGDAA
jgi:hypothetical protein